MSLEQSPRTRSLALSLISTFLLTSFGAQLGMALPPAYKDDFNGCAAIEGEQERKDCCQSVYDDCKVDNCGPGTDAITCTNECFWAQMSCQDGDILQSQVGWDGIVGELTLEATPGSHFGAGPGELTLVPSQSSVVIDVVYEGEDPLRDDVVTLVARCNCPAEIAEQGLECRAVVDAAGTQCKICQPGSDDHRCQPCDTCSASVRPVQTCEESRR